jgi:hypothetical protein
MPMLPDETLEAFEQRLIRQAADAAPPKLARHMSSAEIHDFEVANGLRGHPVPAGLQPPNGVRAGNVYPPPAPVPADKSAFAMSDAELASFERSVGIHRWL